VTIDYLKSTGRSSEEIDLVEAYSKAQGLWHDATNEAEYSEYIELDLSTVVPSIAGPKRPQDRIELSKAKEHFATDIKNYSSSASNPAAVEGSDYSIDNGYVAIASITSCTNTSNPSVMMAAGLLARKAIAKVDGIAHILTTVGNAQEAGGGMQMAGEVRKGTLTLALKPRGERAKQTEIENRIRTELLKVPGARFTISGGGPGEKMSILLSSDNADALTATAQQLEQQLRGVKGLSNISSTASLQRPEIIVRPNALRAAELGVTTQTIGDTVRVATAGDFDQQLSKLNLDNRQIYIRPRIADELRQDINVLSNLRVPSRNGTTSLATVADISTSTGPSQIDRYDRHRYVTVNADLGGSALGEALVEAKKLPAIKNMPSSVTLFQTGDAEIMNELFTGFGTAMLVGVMCVFCVLVLLFEDFFQPVTILSALPLSIGGAIVALLVTGQQMSLPALIGMVMLMGIVTKNSILLVEYTIMSMREHGTTRYAAIVDACHKRARPIVMTTIAMIAGMMPIAIGFGGDASFRQPMAIGVIGGLITSTALSLIVVPVTFTYINGFEQWVYKLFGKKHHDPEMDALSK